MLLVVVVSSGGEVRHQENAEKLGKGQDLELGSGMGGVHFLFFFDGGSTRQVGKRKGMRA